MADKAVVTGGAGFIGRHLVRSLKESGASVVVVDDARCGRPELLMEGVEAVEADISRMTVAEWRNIISDDATVFHLAATKLHTPSADADSLIGTNVTGTQRLAEAAAGLRGVRLVYTSSLYAYGSLGPDLMDEDSVPSPSTLYGATKLMGEGILRAYQRSHGLRWSGARLFFTYGSGQFAEGGYPSVIVRNFERLRDGQDPIVLGSGTQTLDYIHVSDVVKALRLLDGDAAVGQIFNVCTGRATSVLDLVQTMIAVSGSQADVRFGPADWTDGTARVGKLSKRLAAIGWAPSMSLKQGLSECWDADFAS
jgi:UDP-glucose 4-epimerase